MAPFAEHDTASACEESAAEEDRTSVSAAVEEEASISAAAAEEETSISAAAAEEETSISAAAAEEETLLSAAAAEALVSAAAEEEAVAGATTAPGEEASAVCRICFDAGAEDLVSPCACKGTHAFVHESCLLQWRRVQLHLGRKAAANKCDICGTQFPTAVAPHSPFFAGLQTFVRLLANTTWALGQYAWASGLCSLKALAVVGLTWAFGACTVLLYALPLLFCLSWGLYAQGLRLSLAWDGQEVQLALTSFGDPVEGVRDGILLVSLTPGGAFHQTVLYVLEHSDGGSLAFILNKPLEADRAFAGPEGGDPNCTVMVSLRYGGPVLPEATLYLHDLEGAGQRLVQGQRVFFSRGPPVELGRPCRRGAAAAGPQQKKVVMLRGVASWGPQQLEGEIRRSAWGWIPPEHVQLEALLQGQGLADTWAELVQCPQMEVFW